MCQRHARTGTHVYVCVCVCVCARARVCVCACVCVRVRARALRIASTDKILRFINTLIIIIDGVRDAGSGCSHVRIIIR